MNSILALFVLSFFLGLVITPYVKRLARHYGIVDCPSDRKVHAGVIPRAGGVVLFISFYLPFTGAFFIYTNLLNQLLVHEELIWLFTGSLLIFGVGFWDDVSPLKPLIKLAVQILAAVLAYYGGIMIGGISLPGGYNFLMGWLSLPVTVLWFLLVVNAINLIDGLDGLAVGISFFAGIVLLLLSLAAGNYLVAMGFAALAGACLGFLRYNFNPATIFMGDGGSYFLGYMLAGLSLLGSMKSATTVAILIPLVALGVPVFDTLLAPLRRFFRGHGIFRPDRDHVHHRLLMMGLSHDRAVILIYGASVIMGVFALLITALHNINVTYLFIGIALIVFVTIRKLGYFEYLAFDKILGWLQDIKDVSGIGHERRSFLSIQIEMEKAQDVEDLWQTVCHALEILRFDRAELHLYPGAGDAGKNSGDGNAQSSRPEKMAQPLLPSSPSYNGPEQRHSNGGMLDPTTKIFHVEIQGNGRAVQVWTRGYYRRADDAQVMNLFKVDLPLGSSGDTCHGRLLLIKDIDREPLHPFTLRRVEHIRRSVTNALKNQHTQGAQPPPTREEV